MKKMKDTIKFEIPDGYEFDLTKSGNKTIVCTKCQGQDDSRTDAVRNVHESGEMCIYHPKVGDLVYASTINSRQASIYLFEAYGPSVHRGFNSKGWTFSVGTIAKPEFIRPASDKEAALFTRILAENGYEYDPEKKEVRTKRWIAEKGESYLYVSEWGSVEESEEYGFEEDYLRHKSHNYFRLTEREEAEAAAAKFREILSKR